MFGNLLAQVSDPVVANAESLRHNSLLIKLHFGLQVEGLCKGIMHMLGSLTSEYAELLSRLTVNQAPLEMGQELHVGQLLCCMS